MPEIEVVAEDGKVIECLVTELDDPVLPERFPGATFRIREPPSPPKQIDF